MGKKSKRSAHEVQGVAIDAFGQRLDDNKGKNASETRTKDSKPTPKSKHDDTRERHDSNSSDKRQKIKKHEYDDESSRKRPDREFDEPQIPYLDRKTTRDKSDESLQEKSGERQSKKGKSKRSAHEVHGVAIDAFGQRLDDSKGNNASETKDSKPTHKSEHDDISGRHSRKEESDQEHDPNDPSDYRNYEKSKGKDYKSKKDQRQNPILLRINQVTGNLFDAPDTSSLAHCIAEDLQMGAGIAVEFRDRFRKTGYLASLEVKTGGVAVLEDNNRFIYYLITKRLSKGKPTMNSLRNSLFEMAKHVEKNKVKELAMPKIGSGLDRLDWDLVLDTIHTVFCYIDVEITIYNYDGTLSKTEVAPKKTPFVKHINLETQAEDGGTAFLYLSNTDGYETFEMKFLERRRPFLREFKLQRKVMGKVVRIESKPASECVYGLICKVNDKILFEELENCIGALKSMIYKDQYNNIAILGFESDNLDMHHILTLLKHYIPSHITIWVYWKGQIPEDFYNPSTSAM